MIVGTMTFDIGHSSPRRPARPRTAAGDAGTGRFRPPEPAGDIPASPPPEVLAAVDAAWERTAQLAARNREVHFGRDGATGALVVQVRTLAGTVLETIPPSRIFDVLDGATP
jgi:hypothetical protein